MRRAPRALTLANAAYVLALLILSASNAAGPERWWFGSFNLYLPQWVWAVPGLLLLPVCVRWARGWVGILLPALLWVLGPIMGFCPDGAFSGPPDAPAPPGGSRLRVMTYNVKWGIHDAHAIAQDVRAFHPDLIQMQDSGSILQSELGQVLRGWNVRVSGQYVVASPLPLSALEDRDISYAGSQHHCVRYTVRLGAARAAVYDVHLLSPRYGLVAVRRRQISGLVDNTQDRLQEAARLAGYVRGETGPVLLTGDLNAPVQSLVCRRLCSAGLRDAFSEAGFGYGYTYGGYTRLRHPYVRIDHVLASREWRIERCWVGNAQGSEHSPVIADLVL